MNRDDELLAQAESVVYKQLEGDVELKAHVYFPAGERIGGKRPAMLFFFGSGFDSGSITQFAPQALYFASRGAVTVLIDYRTANKHGASPIEAMQDARSAIRWVRFYSQPLGVDPDRVVAVGALAGATIAAAAAMKTDLIDDETDPGEIEGRPNGLVLFNPMIEVTKGGYASDLFVKNDVHLKTAALPNHIDFNLPPMLILHGMSSPLTPSATVEKFVKSMRKKRNHCEFIPFPGRQHSFFNLNVDPWSYDYCNSEIDRFLVGEGFLNASVEVDESDLGEVREIS